MKTEIIMQSPTKYYKTHGITPTLKAIPQYITKEIQYLYHKQQNYKIEINKTKIKIDIETPTEYQAVKFLKQKEKTLIKDLLTEIKPNDNFWDVGANIGIFSLLASKKITNGEILAIEPYQPNIKSLKKNKQKNKTKTNIKIIKKALSNTNTQTNFQTPKKPQQGYQLGGITPNKNTNKNTTNNNKNQKTTKVQTIKADTLTQKNHKPPTIIKIDVEGATPLVIQGMKNILKNQKPRIIHTEIHKPANIPRPSTNDFGYKKQQITKKLKNYGYKNTTIKKRKRETILKSKKQQKNQ